MDQAKFSVNVSAIVISSFLISSLGCQSVEKVTYPANANPAHEISRLQLDVDKAIQRQYDVLAPKELAKTEKYLAAARDESLHKARPSELWQNLGLARGWLNQARQVYKQRHPAAESTLRARQEALNAGARLWDRSATELKALDESFQKVASDLAANPKVQERLNANYRGLEVIAVQETQVGAARNRIAEARDFGAELYAPRTLAQAQWNLKVAQAAIARHPRQPALFTDQVANANMSARQLIEIGALARDASRRTNEDLAHEIALRDREVTSLQAELRGTQLEAAVKQRALRVATRELTAANARVETQQRLNQTLNDVRNKFTRDEADVYRDGDRLLIQLKKMDFKSGSASVPGDAEPLLSKVKAVLREVHAKDVEVQGHADATGTMKVNQRVAKARAEAVKEYLKDETNVSQVSAVGLSESRPIRSNKTPAGRATNRRVDLLITPSLPNVQE